MVDIETLNRRAFAGELELTAVSVHAYAHLTDKYCFARAAPAWAIATARWSWRSATIRSTELRRQTIAVPGTLTTAFLTLQLCLGCDVPHVVVPFDRIIEAVEAGEWNGQPVQAGLVIHEGQLTYGDRGLRLAVDLGAWWFEKTGLPLPLGANAIRKDLGPEVIREVNRLLYESIRYGLDHREEALQYALQYGRDLDHARADRFVGMYVNDWTLDFGPRGREAVRRLLAEGFAAGVIPNRVEPEFVDSATGDRLQVRRTPSPSPLAGKRSGVGGEHR